MFAGFHKVVYVIQPDTSVDPVAMSVLIVGAAGAIGKRLSFALGSRGDRVIAADRVNFLPENVKKVVSAFVPKVDVRDKSSLRAIFKKHTDIHTVWNLAAPLSIETALDPSVAHAVTVGGMTNLLDVMNEARVKRIMFTDSIGSFGASSPRKDCTARWLVENPKQDPGSDYGLQKRGIRELMARYTKDHGGDSRFAVLPGILHSEAIWGAGTTEYALEALRSAAKGTDYQCPIDINVTLPMLFVDDLMRGMMALQDANEEKLAEPERGYALPGLSFNAAELFTEIRKHHPGFQYTVELNPIANKFANLWPDTLSGVESLRDLGYAPRVALSDMVSTVLQAHQRRNKRAQDRFKAIDKNGNGTLDFKELEQFLVDVIVLPPSSEYLRPELCSLLTKIAMHDLDDDKDGQVTMKDFDDWSRRNSFRRMVEQTMEHLQTLLL